MQRPRRTSEFQDDPGCIRRQSRPQQKNTPARSPSVGASSFLAACASGTAKKYHTRQSRIAVPLRQSSSDRLTNPYLTVPPASTQRGVTPQKTPLLKNTANRVLFTAEKQRPGQGVGSNFVPLHNDKKWVQEQTQRITEHLLNQNTIYGGISTEFLNRGLRQMSIKQFVAIINHFLGYVWGNRFTVGNNHVDDIINILQKLQYPYQLNKSWLKTPNTQHSFGNVILLFNFLMDFVPASKEQDDNEMYFDLKEPQDINTSRSNEDPYQIPNLEFQRELLENSEKGFMLWDKQKNEEFSNLKQHTCNLLIQEKCCLDNLEAIEMEIQKSQEILKSLENERPPEDKELQDMKSKLSRDLKKLHNNVKTLEDKCDSNERYLKEKCLRKIDTIKELDTIEMKIKSLETKLNTQPCTIAQRDQMIADVMQHKQMIGIKERTIQDLQNRYHNEQILQSKALKHLNEQIENFNAHMREIKFSFLKQNDNNISLNEDILELSLRPQQTELDGLIPQLEHINKKTLNNIQENKQQMLQLREHCKQLEINIDAKLHPRLNSLRTANTNNVASLEKLVNTHKQEESELLESIRKTDEDLIVADSTINELQSLIENKTRLIEELIQANEHTMQNAEQKHYQHLERKKAFLKAYDEILAEQKDALQQLTKQVELQEKQLEEFCVLFKK